MRFVHLFWDSIACMLAIHPVTKEDDNTFKLSIPKGRHGGTISAQSFLNYIQWRTSQPVSIAANWNEGERLLEAVMPKEHVGSKEKVHDAVTASVKRRGRKITSA